MKSNLDAVSISEESITFKIDAGETLDGITQNLIEKGLIKDAFVFKWYAKYMKLTDFKMGVYYLNTTMDAQTILTALNDPTAAIPKDVIITIIPGDWAKTIAVKLADQCVNVTSDELLALWNDEAYIRSLMSDYSVLTEDIFVDGH